MTDQPLDHWRDRMISALYGELEADELRELEAQLESDEALGREWQELQATRASLQQLARAEVEREFEFRPPHEFEVQRESATVVPMWRWLLASAAGFAAAASVFLALLLVGLRIDRAPSGLLVRFGGSPSDELAIQAQSGELVDLRQTAAGEPYLTRAEFAAMTRLLMEATAARLDEFERRQASGQIELTQALYDALSLRQQRQYDALTNQIQLAAFRAAGVNPYSPEVGSREQWTPLTEEQRHDIE